MSLVFNGLNIVSTHTEVPFFRPKIEAPSRSSDEYQRFKQKPKLPCCGKVYMVDPYRLQAWSSSRDTESSPLSSLVLW